MRTGPRWVRISIGLQCGVWPRTHLSAEVNLVGLPGRTRGWCSLMRSTRTLRAVLCRRDAPDRHRVRRWGRRRVRRRRRRGRGRPSIAAVFSGVDHRRRLQLPRPAGPARRPRRTRRRDRLLRERRRSPTPSASCGSTSPTATPSSGPTAASTTRRPCKVAKQTPTSRSSASTTTSPKESAAEPVGARPQLPRRLLPARRARRRRPRSRARSATSAA